MDDGNTTLSLLSYSYCGHCGGYHTGVCPRIKAIEYHPDGRVKRIEYHALLQPVPGIPLARTGPLKTT